MHIYIYIYIIINHDRLLLACSASSPSGPAAPAGGAADGQRHHGFWLQHASESRLGRNAVTDGAVGSAGLWQGGSFFGAAGGAAAPAGGKSGQRPSCLEEDPDPCAYAGGVWVATSRRPGAGATEVEVTTRVDASSGAGAGAGSQCTSLTLDSPVLGVAEESLGGFAFGQPAGLCSEGELSIFQATKSFALLLPSSVQVLRLSFKTQACCFYYCKYYCKYYYY